MATALWLPLPRTGECKVLEDCALRSALGKAALLLRSPRMGALALPQLEGKEGPEGGLDGIGQVKYRASRALKNTVFMWVLQAA